MLPARQPGRHGDTGPEVEGQVATAKSLAKLLHGGVAGHGAQRTAGASAYRPHRVLAVHRCDSHRAALPIDRLPGFATVGQ